MPMKVLLLLLTLTLACGLLAVPAFADTSSLTIASDRYLAGDSVSYTGPPVTDLFMAGNRVVVAAPTPSCPGLPYPKKSKRTERG